MALTVRLTPGYVYTDLELDTAAKRNALGNPTIDLEGSISAILIADGSVTTDKLADGVLSNDAAGHAKMEDGYLSADAEGRAKMEDGYVTAIKAEETFRQGVAMFATSVFSTAAGVDKYQLTLTPAATAYTAGMRVAWVSGTANTNPVVIEVSGMAPKSLVIEGATPCVAGQVSGLVEAIFDGTNFQLLNYSDIVFNTGEYALATGQVINVPHGLGQVPSHVRFVVRCKTADAATAYAVADELNVHDALFQSGGFTYHNFVGGGNLTNVFLVCAQTSFAVPHKTTGVSTTVTAAANWRLVGYIRR